MAKKCKLSDWVADELVRRGITDVFMVTGGGAMHLNQSLGAHPDLTSIFNHHEQASAMAADSYFRSSGRVAVVNVTSGPGGTNAITGVYGAYVDSLAMLVISGQVKRETTVRCTGAPLRQLGDQEIDIVRLVEPVTKYAIMVDEPNSIKYHLEKALYLATSGRPGPVWLDIPIDVQSSLIDPEALEGFQPEALSREEQAAVLTEVIDELISAIGSAKRPVIYAGSGVRISGSHDLFLECVEKLGVPVVTAWNAHDLIWNEHPLYAGRPGTLGDRGGNFVTQNADLLLVLGSRLNIRQVSYNWQNFAPRAKIVWVDIDPTELAKPTVRPHVPIIADLAIFLAILRERSTGADVSVHADWVRWCRDTCQRYPVLLPEYSVSRSLNPYLFMDRLFMALPEGQSVVTGNGSACVMSFQAAQLKRGQRLWTNSGCASMGYELPAAIGAAMAQPNSPIVCIAGEGSIMMNLQELQTIATLNLPIVVFLINNGGYVSISQTHRNFFAGREIGAGPKSGLGFPEFDSIARAFGFTYSRIEGLGDPCSAIKYAISQSGPHLCEVIVDPDQQFSPKLASRQLDDGTMVSPSLEDMAPFLDRDEILSNMIL